MLFMTDNSKLKGSTGKPFWVARALPKCLARPVLAYLAYIRPFADSLHKVLAPQEAERNAYMYISYYSSRQHFSTTDGSTALYNSTSALSMPLKIGLYRQVAVAIGKKHVENPVKILNPWEPSTMEEQISAWQCTHSVQTHRNSYARSSEMPTGLTEDLILRYLYNSIKWHAFGDLERRVELSREVQVVEKGFGGPKRPLKELDINVTGRKRPRVANGQHVRVRSRNALLWEATLAEYEKKGFRHLDDFWTDYPVDEEAACASDAQERPCISLKSFNACMDFLGRLTSGDNIERAMGFIRAERLRSRAENLEVDPDEDLPHPFHDPSESLLSGLVKVYRVQHQGYPWRNILMSTVAEQISPSSTAFKTPDALLDRQYQEILLGQNPEEFDKWSQTHWHSLAQNLRQWLTVLQHPKWKRSCTFGLGLLLPVDWEWNVEQCWTDIDMATWSWFVDRLHLICPNLHKLALALNDYGRAIVDRQALPPLLEMEIQRITDLNILATEDIGCRVTIEAEEARRIVKFYEYLARRPSSWQCTMKLAQQHF